MRRHAKALVAALTLLACLVLGVTLAAATAPVVTVENASEVAFTTAKAEGTVNPETLETFCHFEYVTDDHFINEGEFENPGTAPCDVEPLTGSGAQTVKAELTGLAPDTIYHLRLVAANEDGQSEAVAAATFETAAVAKPLVTTDNATDVEYTTAKASGEVEVANPDAAFNAPCRFEYVTQDHFENEGEFAGAGEAGCDVEPVGPGTTEVKADLAGLSPDTKYHLRLVAANQGGATAVEAASTFKTLAVAKPTVSSVAVGSITATSAHFSGLVDPNAPEAAPAEPAVEAAFKAGWSFTCAPTGCEGPKGGTVAADNTGSPVSDDAINLQPNTEYTVTLHATNLGGEETATAAPFTTPAAAPDVTTPSSTPLGQGEVGIGSFVTPRNSPITDCHFEYGPTASYGTSVPCAQDPGSGPEPTLVNASLSGLTPGATYHFRILATNATGTTSSDDAIFTVLSAPSQADCPNAGAVGTSFLPDCRAYEMVSPVGKNGGEVIADTTRTRAASDGDAAQFSALLNFGDAHGGTISADYMALRGANGWTTHAITPPEGPLTLLAAFQALDPNYEGEFSPDLSKGVFRAFSPLTDAPNVAQVANLYVRNDLRTPGTGSYRLLTDCPLCAAALPPITNIGPIPRLAGASADFSHVLFESRLNLLPGLTTGSNPKLYEWVDGSTHLVGILPSGLPATGCIGNSPCSQAGQGAISSSPKYTPRVISADGSRIFFTLPTTSATSGVIYMRDDHGTDDTVDDTTLQLNASERTDCAETDPCAGVPAPDTASAATYWTTSIDGTRAFFTTAEQLTDDDHDSSVDLYMWDLTAALGHRLTRLSADSNNIDSPADTRGAIGASADGRYVYFITAGQIVPGKPTVNLGIYLWHDGNVSFVGALPDGGGEVNNLTARWTQAVDQMRARVTVDGKHLLFVSLSGKGLLSVYGGTDYEQAACGGCRELYVYSADTDRLQCASCSSDDTPASGFADVAIRRFTGAANNTNYLSHPIAADGRYIFFTTASSLVPEDVNGPCASVFSNTGSCSDAYVYDAREGSVHLLSSGHSDSPSFFMDASVNGSNAFFLTRDRLVGWDNDNAYDLYDARVGGGFSQPPVPATPCSGDGCQAASAPQSPLSPSQLSGPANPAVHRPKHRKRKHHGKQHHHKAKQHKRAANDDRRASR